MVRRRRTSLLALITSMTTIVLSGSAVNAATATDGAPALSWGPCAEAPDNPLVECASLPVPVDWAHPGGPRIDLVLARIRAAVGDRQLTYRGWSYASLLGQQYAEQYPSRVRAVVVDSNIDHSADTREYLDQRAASLQDAFDEFVAWCGRDTDCALHGRDVKAYWADLLARAARGELHGPEDPTYALRPSDVINFAKNVLQVPDWAFLADNLLAVGGGAAPTAAAAREPPELATDRTGLFCNDFSLPVRDYEEYAAHLRRSARIAPDMRWAHSTLFTDCLGYPTRIPNPQQDLRVRGVSTPLLVVNSRHDPGTGYNAATRVARQLGRAGVLLTYDGWGHGVYPGRSGCVDAIAHRYLIDREPPAQGTHCPAVEDPPVPQR